MFTKEVLTCFGVSKLRGPSHDEVYVGRGTWQNRLVISYAVIKIFKTVFSFSETKTHTKKVSVPTTILTVVQKRESNQECPTL